MSSRLAKTKTEKAISRRSKVSLRRYLVPCPANAILFQNAFQTKQFACCVIKVDRKIRYIIIFVSLYLLVFFPMFISFWGVEWWVLILPMSFCVQFESRQPTVYAKKKITINHFAVPNRVKKSTNFVQEKWQLTGGGDRYLRKSLTLSWRTRKLSESNSSSVLSAVTTLTETWFTQFLNPNYKTWGSFGVYGGHSVFCVRVPLSIRGLSF